MKTFNEKCLPKIIFEYIFFQSVFECLPKYALCALKSQNFIRSSSQAQYIFGNSDQRFGSYARWKDFDLTQNGCSISIQNETTGVDSANADLDLHLSDRWKYQQIEEIFIHCALSPNFNGNGAGFCIWGDFLYRICDHQFGRDCSVTISHIGNIKSALHADRCTSFKRTHFQHVQRPFGHLQSMQWAINTVFPEKNIFSFRKH